LVWFLSENNYEQTEFSSIFFSGFWSRTMMDKPLLRLCFLRRLRVFVRGMAALIHTAHKNHAVTIPEFPKRNSPHGNCTWELHGTLEFPGIPGEFGIGISSGRSTCSV
jgi:hypothetical protein